MSLWRITRSQESSQKHQQTEESVTDAGVLNIVMDPLQLDITADNGFINNDSHPNKIIFDY